MKIPVVQTVLVLFCGLLLTAGESRAHYEPRHKEALVDAAVRFEKAARRVHRTVYDATGRSYLTESAHEMVLAAHQYRRTLKQRRGYGHPWRRFRDLAEHFRDFRYRYRHSHLPGTRRSHGAMRRLVHSFRYLRHESRLAQRARREYRAREFHGWGPGQRSPRPHRDRRWPAADRTVYDEGA